MSKWNRQYVRDLAERVVAAGIGGALALIPVDVATTLTPELVYAVVGVPMLFSLAKGLLANLATGDDYTPSASLLDVSSNPE